MKTLSDSSNPHWSRTRPTSACWVDRGENMKALMGRWLGNGACVSGWARWGESDMEKRRKAVWKKVFPSNLLLLLPRVTKLKTRPYESVTFSFRREHFLQPNGGSKRWLCVCLVCYKCAFLLFFKTFVAARRKKHWSLTQMSALSSGGEANSLRTMWWQKVTEDQTLQLLDSHGCTNEGFYKDPCTFCNEPNKSSGCVYIRLPYITIVAATARQHWASTLL